METRVAKCKKCGNDSFKFKWKVLDENHRIKLLLCHDGYGFQVSDSEICCSKCGKWVEYEQEDFLEIVEEKEADK